MRPVKKKLKATPARGITKEELKAAPTGELKAPPSGGESRRNEIEVSLASGSTNAAWNVDAVQRLVQDVTTWQATLDAPRMPN